MDTATAFVPITKAEKQDDGSLVVEGPASNSALDRDQQIADEGWLSKAMPTWFSGGGNVREQHDGKRAVGVATSYEKRDDGQHWISARVVDPVTVAKVNAGVLRGFSFGARNPRVVVDKAAAGGRIVDGDIYEVSLVDRPANPGCMFTVAKADGEGTLQPVEAPELVEPEQPSFTPADLKKVLDSLNADEPGEPEVMAMQAPEDVQKDVSAAQRKKYAKSGIAMSNGDFPIPDKGHLRSAIGHLGNYDGDKAKAKRHIIARAKALDAVSMLPDDWHVSKALDAVEQVEALVPDLSKADTPEDEISDVDGGKAAIAAVARLIVSEANSLAEGRDEEAFDISILLEAVSALQCFVRREGDQAAELAHASAAKADDGDSGTPASTEPPEADAAKADTPETTPAPAGDNTDGIAAMVQEAITKATQSYKDELDLVKAELAEVRNAPVPGGPVRTRTTSQTAVAHKADQLRSERDRLQQMVDTTTGNLQQGYRERLHKAEADLAAIQ